MDNLDNENSQHKFICYVCDYFTSRKNDFDKHILTRKHERKILDNHGCLNGIKCKCGKTFKYMSGLCKHKHKCKVVATNSQNSQQFYKKEDYENDDGEVNYKELIMTLINQNKELQTQLVELSKEKSIINNCSVNNSNNKTFNLQVFLNEKCKDALNIDEFIDSLKISLTDLENLGENGFINGVSKIFVNGLKSLDVYKRPIHCSDLKRETMYLKEQNVWEKDNENNDRLKKVVKMVAHKNMLKVKDWKEKYPDYKDDSSKRNDQYLKILMGAAVPYKKEDEETSFNKIIKNIAKEVIIEKN